MTRWSRLRYENGMSHVVSDDLLPVVQEAMARATPPGVLEGTTSVDTIILEQGGPCALGRPEESFAFHGLLIKIPSEDLQTLLIQWRDAPLVTLLNQNFYRLTSWRWQCLVVTPEQRTEFMNLLEEHADQAERRAVAFWAHRASPQEILRTYNESRGLIVPYGPDKIAKFRS